MHNICKGICFQLPYFKIPFSSSVQVPSKIFLENLFWVSVSDLKVLRLLPVVKNEDEEYKKAQNTAKHDDETLLLPVRNLFSGRVYGQNREILNGYYIISEMKAIFFSVPAVQSRALAFSTLRP